MDRRLFLIGALGAGGLVLLGPGMLSAQSVDGPYGPLGPEDKNGLRLPAGFQSRIVAVTGTTVAGTSYEWHSDPDGGATFALPDGGWVYVSNSEADDGGAGMIRFDSSGAVIDAGPILSGTKRNCAGGPTPWGTWLSCEEHDKGLVYECDPLGVEAAEVRLAMGRFQHEAAAADPERRVVYLTEDRSDGCLYRYVPDSWGDLSTGRLEVMTELDGQLGWAVVPDPGAENDSTRDQVDAAKHFDGGEGAWYDDGSLYFTTKGDNRVWRYHAAANVLEVIYDRATSPTPVLSGVDNITVSSYGDLFVCEDGGNMELVMLSTEGHVAPFLESSASGSELTGVAFDPSGTRLYLSSQRNPGETYEITGPFRLGPTTIGGLITFADGGPAAGAAVDLLETNPDTGRSRWLTSVRTESDGRFQFTVAPGCYAVNLTAPVGQMFGSGSASLQLAACVVAGQQINDLNGSLASLPGSVATLGGQVTGPAGSVTGLAVSLYEATGDGSRGRRLEDSTTDDAGRYEFKVRPGCYVVTVAAPADGVFDSGSGHLQLSRCVTEGEISDQLNGRLR